MDRSPLWEMILARLRQYIGQTWNLQLIADMTGSEPSTIGSWLVDDRPAKGERLLRLWHLLAALGCESPELETFPKYNRYVGELVAFNVVTMDEAGQILKVANASNVLSILLRGQAPMHPEYNESDLREMYDGQLVEAKRKLPALPAVPAQGGSPPVQEAVQTSAEAVGSLLFQPAPDIQAVMRSLAILLGTAQPLVKTLLSDKVAAAQLSEFRSTMGEDNLFALSNAIERLCSERARTGR